jgi:hypothetical protein
MAVSKANTYRASPCGSGQEAGGCFQDYESGLSSVIRTGVEPQAFIIAAVCECARMGEDANVPAPASHSGKKLRALPAELDSFQQASCASTPLTGRDCRVEAPHSLRQCLQHGGFGSESLGARLTAPPTSVNCSIGTFPAVFLVSCFLTFHAQRHWWLAPG